jgi:hypothetical protein
LLRWLRVAGHGHSGNAVTCGRPGELAVVHGDSGSLAAALAELGGAW